MKIFDFFRYYWGAFRIRIRQYLVVLGWFLRESIWPVKFKAAGVVLIGFLGVTFQVGALGLVVVYANVLARGGEISLLHYHYAPRESLTLLILFSLGFLLASILSAWMIYLSNKWIFSLALAREKEVIKQTLQAVSLYQSIIPTAVIKEELPEQSVMKLIGGDARIVTRIIRVILSAVVPLITFLIATATLFITNLSLSLWLTLVVFLSLFFYFKVSLESLSDAKLMETTGKPLSIMKRTLLRRFLGTSAKVNHGNDSIADSLLESELLENNMLGFRGRIMASDKSRLVSDHLMAVCIVLIFLILGYQMLAEHDNWNQLVVYLLALRYCLANFQKVTGTITTVNRFYAVIKRSYDFSQNVQRIQSVEDSSETCRHIYCYKMEIPGTEKEYLIENGNTVRVFSPIPLSRFSLPSIFCKLFAQNHRNIIHTTENTWIFTRKASIPPIPFKEYLGVDEQTNLIELLQENIPAECHFDLSELYTEKNYLNNEGHILDKSWKGLSNELKGLLGLLAAANSGMKIVVFEEEVLRFIPDNVRERMMTRFHDCCFIIYGEKCNRLHQYDMDKVILLGNDSVEAIGSSDWLFANEEHIRAVLRKAKKERLGGDMSEDEDDDIDLM